MAFIMAWRIASYNSAGIHDYIHEYLANNEPDLLLLPETWLLQSHLARPNALHEDYLAYGISGMAEDVLL